MIKTFKMKRIFSLFLSLVLVSSMVLGTITVEVLASSSSTELVKLETVYDTTGKALTGERRKSGNRVTARYTEDGENVYIQAMEFNVNCEVNTTANSDGSVSHYLKNLGQSNTANVRFFYDNSVDPESASRTTTTSGVHIISGKYMATKANSDGYIDYHVETNNENNIVALNGARKAGKPYVEINNLKANVWYEYVYKVNLDVTPQEFTVTYRAVDSAADEYVINVTKTFTTDTYNYIRLDKDFDSTNSNHYHAFKDVKYVYYEDSCQKAEITKVGSGAAVTAGQNLIHFELDKEIKGLSKNHIRVESATSVNSAADIDVTSDGTKWIVTAELENNLEAWTNYKLVIDKEAYAGYKQKESDTSFVDIADITKDFIALPEGTYDYSSGTGTLLTGDDGNFLKEKYETAAGIAHYPNVTVCDDELAGKLKGDKYYMLQDAVKDQRYDMTDFATDDVLKRDIIEFDICIPTGAYGYRTLIRYRDYVITGSTNGGQYEFKTDGIYNFGSNKLLIPWDGNKWHHVAILSPGIVKSDADGVEYDTYVRIYVDGILSYEQDYGSTFEKPYGIRYCQTNGLCPQSDYDDNNPEVSSSYKNWTTVACYLDNIRWTNDDLEDIIPYNTLSKVESDEYGVDTNGGTITVMTDDVTVADIEAGLDIDEDASIRIYDKSGKLVADKEALVLDGYKVIVADKNGTTTERSYAYYDIRVIADGNYAFDVPYIEKDEATGASKGVVKLFNKTGSEKTYKVYIALYGVDGSLELVEPAVLTVADGKAGEIETKPVTFAKDKKVKLFVWKNDGITPEFPSILLDK